MTEGLYYGALTGEKRSGSWPCRARQSGKGCCGPGGWIDGARVGDHTLRQEFKLKRSLHQGNLPEDGSDCGHMHEFGLTRELLETVLAEAKKHDAARVSRVLLAVGELSGFTDESLRLCFEEVSRGTLASGAELEFRNVPGSREVYLEELELDSG